MFGYKVTITTFGLPFTTIDNVGCRLMALMNLVAVAALGIHGPIQEALCVYPHIYSIGRMQAKPDVEGIMQCGA